jgi:hydroxyethylthiazole kinase-like uncharacterized protein yjeF
MTHDGSMIRPFEARDAASFLREPTESDDKYSRGVVGLRTGSSTYPGAAVLGVEAAARAGAGMVRYVGPESVTSAVHARRPEVVAGVGRVQTWVIGSGTDASKRDAAETAALRELLTGSVPVVVDAGALDLVGPRTDAPRAPIVVTPHGRELAVMIERLGLSADGAEPDAGAHAARLVARATGAVVLSKGAVTRVATPDGVVREVRAGTPWLATAGTGDVLAGVIGTLIAAGQAAAEASTLDAHSPLDLDALADLAAAGAVVHGLAARIAAGRFADGVETAMPGHPIVALDVAHAIPAAWQALRAAA